MFKAGALGVCIGSVLLGIAVLTSAFLRRELSTVEVVSAFVVAAVLGTWWWRLMLRHMRSRGHDV